MSGHGVDNGGHNRLGLMSMAGYTKLFNSILASTIWRSSLETKVLWITLLAMADSDGIAASSVPGLAHIAGLSIEQTEAALSELSSPDKFSRTKDYEGRRIEAVDGGWRVLNHAKYRSKMNADERREYKRLKQQEYRKKARGHVDIHKSTRGRGGHNAEADTDTEASSVDTPIDGKPVDEIPCPICGAVGWLKRSQARNGFDAGWWCRPSGGCGENFPLEFPAIWGKLSQRARNVLKAAFGKPEPARHRTLAEIKAEALKEAGL